MIFLLVYIFARVCVFITTVSVIAELDEKDVCWYLELQQVQEDHSRRGLGPKVCFVLLNIVCYCSELLTFHLFTASLVI